MRSVPCQSRTCHRRPSWRALITGISRTCPPRVSPPATTVARSLATREEAKSPETTIRGGVSNTPPRGWVSGRSDRQLVALRRDREQAVQRLQYQDGSGEGKSPLVDQVQAQDRLLSGHQQAVLGLIPIGVVPELDARPADLDVGLHPPLRHLDGGDGAGAAAFPVRRVGVRGGRERRAPARAEDIGGIAEVARVGLGVRLVVGPEVEVVPAVDGIGRPAQRESGLCPAAVGALQVDQPVRPG